jgi:transposase
LELSDDISILKELVFKLLTRIDGLERENTALKAENAELRLRLNQNSQNSHKPPSSDGLSKKPAFQQTKGKKTGGQVGHQGKTLSMVLNPDAIVIHHSPFCPCCLKTFTSSDVSEIIQKRQVFDIPQPRLEVVEHQLGVISCCGQSHKGDFPTAVTRPVQYGSKIKALSVLLNNDYKIPFEKIEQLLGDLYNCSFNESTAISANIDCFNGLACTETNIKEQILHAEVVNFDETGMRVEGKLHWFHTASTTLFTYLFVHTHRGKEALLSAKSVIKDFKNWAVHDCWVSYFDFSDCSHALCNAHLMRELQARIENKTQWAMLMQNLLIELYNESQKGTVIVENKVIWIEKYQNICLQAHNQEPPPIKNKRGKPKNTKGRNLLNRLIKHQDGVLAFAFQEAIPFTNNQAERDIRCLKTKQKVATSFRTFRGAENYARIQSFVSTLRKHQMNVFQNLINIFNNQHAVFEHA